MACIAKISVVNCGSTSCINLTIPNISSYSSFKSPVLLPLGEYCIETGNTNCVGTVIFGACPINIPTDISSIYAGFYCCTINFGENSITIPFPLGPQSGQLGNACLVKI